MHKEPCVLSWTQTPVSKLVAKEHIKSTASMAIRMTTKQKRKEN